MRWNETEEIINDKVKRVSYVLDGRNKNGRYKHRFVSRIVKR